MKNPNRTSNNLVLYSDDLSSLNKLVGIILPTNDPITMKKKFLSGLPNMVEICDYATILINFQFPYTDDDMQDVLDTCHRYGFKVRYTYNTYKFEKPYVPFNLMREDTAALLPDAKIYLSVDDDLKVLPTSPIIGKSGGRQYLEIIHYMVKHPKCGLVSTTGTIGKTPPRNYIGPNYKKGLNTYIQTGLGLFAINLNTGNEEYWLPKQSHNLYGAMEDLIAGAWRLSEGLYHAKANYIRVEHHYQTGTTVGNENEDKSHDTGWDKEEVLLSNNVKFLRESWSPNYSRSGAQVPIDKTLYLSKKGLHIWEESVAKDLTTFYPIDLDEEILHKEIRDLTTNLV